MKKVVDKIVKWLQDSVKEANCNGVVYGLSGGVDSSVVAILSKLAFNDNSLALIMPIDSCKEDEEDAKLLIEKFNLNFEKVDLSNVNSEFKKVIEIGNNSMAYANIKPRIRMTTLYYYAQLKRYLVVGTSNKSEFTVGYFTKYGDSASDLMPLVDFTKKEVYDLAKYLSVPDKIIKKPPTSGLFTNLTDEEEMGFSYDDLEKFINNEKMDKNLEEKIIKMVKISNHKRSFAKMFRR